MFSDDWSKRAAAVIGWTVLYREWKRPRLYLLVHYAEGCLADEVSEKRHEHKLNNFNRDHNSGYRLFVFSYT